MGGCSVCLARWESVETSSKSSSLHPAFISNSATGLFSACDIQRLHLESTGAWIWLTAHGVVYKIPSEWIANVHPGGKSSILTHSGKDCSVDFDFHSFAAQQKWKKFSEGKLVLCVPAAFPCSIA